MIARPQLPPTMLLWMNTMIASKKLISGENASWMTLARIGMLVVSSLCGGRDARAATGSPPRWWIRALARSRCVAVGGAEHPLGVHRIVSAVAPRVAPQHPPRGQHEAT